MNGLNKVIKKSANWLLKRQDQRTGGWAGQAGGTVNTPKPNSDLFLYAAQQLNSKAENCVVIEDAPLGIEAAKRAGMKCVAMATTYDREKFSRADIVVDSFSEIDLNVL